VGGGGVVKLFCVMHDGLTFLPVDDDQRERSI